MASRIFIGSLIVCVLAAGLSQVPDPSVFGIQEEPSIILFYAASGPLVGISGLLAAGSGIYLAVTRVWSGTDRSRWLLLAAFVVVMTAIVIAAVRRLR